MALERGETAPRLTLFTRQRAVRLPMAWLREQSARMMEASLHQVGPRGAGLRELAEVEATFVSDAAIARVHHRFMSDPTATDVITFEHGELVISAETAARAAEANAEPLERELVRYLVHGLLHLNGHEDADPVDAAAMWEAQEAVVAELWRANNIHRP